MEPGDKPLTSAQIDTLIGKDEPTSETNFLEFTGADSQGLVPSHNESSFLEVADSDELPQAHNYRWKYAVLGTTLAVTGLAAALYLTFPGKISFDPKKAEPAVSTQEYLQIPCDDDPECFGLKLKVSDLETQLNKPVQPQYIKEDCDNTPLFACQGELSELHERVDLWVGQREAEKVDYETRISTLAEEGRVEREQYRVKTEGLQAQLKAKTCPVTYCDEHIVKVAMLESQLSRASACQEELELQLANPIIRTEVVEIPCEDNPECSALKLRVSELETQLDKPVQPQYIKEDCDNTPLFACQGELSELHERVDLWVGQREAEKMDCETIISGLQKQGNKEREEYRTRVEGLQTQLSAKPQVVETPCDITPLLDRQANVEALLSQLANPVIKTEVVELPCETNPIYEQMFIQATNLQAKLDALLSQPPVPATPNTVYVPVENPLNTSCVERVTYLEGILMTEIPIKAEDEARVQPRIVVAAPQPQDWYEKFKTFDPKDFRTVLFEYADYLGKERAIAEVGRETLFTSFAEGRLNSPEYNLEKDFFNQKLYHFVGTSPKEVIACVNEPKTCR